MGAVVPKHRIHRNFGIDRSNFNPRNGIWSSEKDDKGAYIEVTIAPCESDASLTCGVISKAFIKSGEDPD